METENIDARNAIESTIKSNRKIILELLSSISNFCGKEVDFDNIKATPPSFLFDKLKSAEQYDNQHDMKFKNTAKKLKEFLISKIEDILQKAITFLNHGHADRECEESSSSNNLSSLRVVNTVSDGQDSHSTPHGVNYNISTLEDCEDLVKRVEMFTPYLPADLYEVYRSKLLEIKNLVEIARKAHASRIEEAINSTTDHYRKGFRLFYNYKERDDFYRMKDIGDVLNKILRTFISRINADLSEGKLLSALSALLPSFSDWKKYTDDLDLWQSNPARYRRYLSHSGLWSGTTKLEINTPINLFEGLQKSLKNAVDSTILTIMSGKQISLAEMAPHFDGLVLLLSTEGNDILSSLTLMEKSIKERISTSIISVGDSFAHIGQEVTKLLQMIDSTLTLSTDSTSVIDKVKHQLSQASMQISVAKRCIPLFNTVCALSVSPSCLGSKDLLQLQNMKLSSVSYQVLKDMINDTVEKLQQIANSSLHGNQYLITPNASDRNSFYSKMQFALTLLTHWDSDQAKLEGRTNTHAFEESSKNKIMSEIENIGAAADRLVTSTDYTQLGILYDNLRSIFENFESVDLKNRASSRMKTIDNLFFEKIKLMKQRGWLDEDQWDKCPFGKGLYERIANELINMKLVSNQIAQYKKRIDADFIDELLKDYKSRPNGAAGPSFFLDLTTYLTSIRTSDAPIVAQLLAEHSAFYGHKLLLRNERVLRFTVENTLSNITGDDKHGNLHAPLSKETKDRILEISKRFEEDYWALVGTGLEVDKDLETELAALVVKTKCVAEDSHLPQNEKILKLMALIFAYWTLNGSKHYQETIASQGSTLSAEQQAASVKKSNSLLQPHSGQIVGILRMFGLDSDDISAIAVQGNSTSGKSSSKPCFKEFNK